MNEKAKEVRPYVVNKTIIITIGFAGSIYTATTSPYLSSTPERLPVRRPWLTKQGRMFVMFMPAI